MNVDLSSLLQRPAITFDPDRGDALLRGARVLITGAGGSIGSDLCQRVVSARPDLVILLERERVPAVMWQWQRASAVAPIFWPLTASARLTEGIRWRLSPYTLLGQALPMMVAIAPGALVLPVSMIVMVALTIVQGVLFEHYRRRCEETGVPPPSLPLEAALLA